MAHAPRTVGRSAIGLPWPLPPELNEAALAPRAASNADGCSSWRTAYGATSWSASKTAWAADDGKEGGTPCLAQGGKPLHLAESKLCGLNGALEKEAEPTLPLRVQADRQQRSEVA